MYLHKSSLVYSWCPDRHEGQHAILKANIKEETVKFAGNLIARLPKRFLVRRKLFSQRGIRTRQYTFYCLIKLIWFWSSIMYSLILRMRVITKCKLQYQLHNELAIEISIAILLRTAGEMACKSKCPTRLQIEEITFKWNVVPGWKKFSEANLHGRSL